MPFKSDPISRAYFDASWNSKSATTLGWQYLHQGGRLDTMTGWFGFRNRDLIPGEGRWAERDPLGYNGSALNLYRDASNNPSKNWDPSGLVDYNYKYSGEALLWDKHLLHGDVPKPGDINPDLDCDALYDWINAVRRSLDNRTLAMRNLSWKTGRSLTMPLRLPDPDAIREYQNHITRYNLEQDLLVRLFGILFSKCGGRQDRPTQVPPSFPKPGGDCNLTKIQKKSGAGAPEPKIPVGPRGVSPLPPGVIPPAIQLPVPAPTGLNSRQPSMRAIRKGDPFDGRPYEPPPLAPWQEELLSMYPHLNDGRLPQLVPVPGSGPVRGGGPARNLGFPARTNQRSMPARVPVLR